MVNSIELSFVKRAAAVPLVTILRNYFKVSKGNSACFRRAVFDAVVAQNFRVSDLRIFLVEKLSKIYIKSVIKQSELASLRREIFGVHFAIFFEKKFAFAIISVEEWCFASLFRRIAVFDAAKRVSGVWR